MPLRLTAPHAIRPVLRGRRARAAMLRPANDGGEQVLEQPVLRAALYHFAAHGLAAAQVAGREGAAALAAGNSEAGQHWNEIARLLGRRRTQDREACEPATHDAGTFEAAPDRAW